MMTQRARDRRTMERRMRHERRAKTPWFMSPSTERWLSPRIAAWGEVLLVFLGFLLSALLLVYLWA